MVVNLETAILAGGCFWCSEAIFKRIKGVKEVTSGYSDGAESIQVKFDPTIIPYKTLLYIFFKTHDPTTLNRQGYDIGPQYRSAIFYADEAQKKIAEEEKSKVKGAVTQISQFKNFQKAADDHQDFYTNNPGSSYCRLVIDPKIKKLYKDLKEFT